MQAVGKLSNTGQRSVTNVLLTVKLMCYFVVTIAALCAVVAATVILVFLEFTLFFLYELVELPSFLTY